MNESQTAVPLESRHTRIAPPTAPFLDHLYRLAATGQIAWQWNGLAETPEAFYASLSERALVVHAIIDKRSEQEIGLLVAYDTNVFHRFTYVSLYLLPEFQRKVWPNEAVLLFGNLLFVRFGMRNLYAQSAEPDFLQFSSGDGLFFEVEGHLKGRLIVDGTPRDLFILGLSENRWREVGLPLLDRCTRTRDGAPLANVTIGLSEPSSFVVTPGRSHDGYAL